MKRVLRAFLPILVVTLYAPLAAAQVSTVDIRDVVPNDEPPIAAAFIEVSKRDILLCVAGNQSVPCEHITLPPGGSLWILFQRYRASGGDLSGPAFVTQTVAWWPQTSAQIDPSYLRAGSTFYVPMSR